MSLESSNCYAKEGEGVGANAQLFTSAIGDGTADHTMAADTLELSRNLGSKSAAKGDGRRTTLCSCAI